MKKHMGILLAVAVTGSTALSAEWEIRTTNTATVEILHHGAPVVTCGWAFWGAGWKYGNAAVTITGTADDQKQFSGPVSTLDLKIDGKIAKSAPNQLKYTFKIDSAKEIKDAVGGGFQFNLSLKSPTFPNVANFSTSQAATPEPVLLENNKGWKWEVASGKFISVEFADPVASVYFEKGQKNTIRTFFEGKEIAAGTVNVTMTVSLPEGGQVVPSLAERYGKPDTSTWFKDAMLWNKSPVDVSFLNDKPAGKHGFCQAKGDQLVFADGTPGLFWGGNIAAYAIFSEKDAIAEQAKRIAQLGYNLMRIHHHDSMSWVTRTVIDKKQKDSQHLDDEVMDRLDWWIKCLKDEGVYVWLDLHVGRIFQDGDEIGDGWDEIKKRKGEIKGYCFMNERIVKLMQEFNEKYLNHVNSYTKLAYKDEPAVMGMLITNENDFTHHFGNLMLADKNNPVHHKKFLAAVKEFSEANGLDAAEVGKTWVPGPSKIFLNEYEHRFNATMLEHLKKLGVQVPLSTTNSWSGVLHSLPAVADSGIIDVHSYGGGEELSANARYSSNFISETTMAHIYGKPLSITEWNLPYPTVDRFISPLYMASISALQGWDAPMIYNYSQSVFTKPDKPHQWSTYPDPALNGMMPAAALAFRAGQISPAKEAYCLQLSREDCYMKGLGVVAAIRTLTERSKLTIGLPDMKELPWTKAPKPDAGYKVITDINQDFIPPGQDFVASDTGELTRNWIKGIQTIDAAKCQAAQGWIGGEAIATKNVSFKIEKETPKAAVAVNSMDNKPIGESSKILITAIARVVTSEGGKMPLLSEPVKGSLTIKSANAGLKLVPLGGDGAELEAVPAEYKDGAYTVKLPAERGTHWFLLKS
ncbi:MAG: cellulase family glycosylhydrolase [Planctomycetes bacterium]|nr:cellulase family glycosylhydrolase [Planctomycetota bacterium]